MSLLLDLPDALIKTIVCEWLEPTGFVRLDTALCNAGLREKFLKFIHDNRGTKEKRLLLCDVAVGHFEFPAFESSSYGQSNKLADLLNYAEKRHIGLRNLEMTQWPYFGVDSMWQTFLDGVSTLQINGPQVFDAPITNVLLRTYAGFRNVQEVHLISRNASYVPLSKWCTQLHAMWPQLTKLTINCSRGGAPLSLSTDDDKWNPSTPNDSTRNIPDPLFESLHIVCSRLIELCFVDVALYPVHLFTLFGEMTMPHLESLEFLYTFPDDIMDSHYSAIDLSHTRHPSATFTQSEINGKVEPEAITDIHDISFATAIVARHTSTMPVGDSAGRILHRPRHRVTTQITSLDELCGYFAQSRRGALPSLRKLKGDSQWVYALLPLATAASLRTLEVEVDDETSAAIWAADSDFGLQIPSLRNVSTLVVSVGRYTGNFHTFVDDVRFPMDVLLNNMPQLESIDYGRDFPFETMLDVSDDSFAGAFRKLPQPLHRLRSLTLLENIARSPLEMHEFFEQLSHTAPNLRKLSVTELKVKLPCLLYSLRNSVSLESLYLKNLVLKDTLGLPSWWELNLLCTDFSYLCQLTNLSRVHIFHCGVYVRDSLLIRVFRALPRLAEFVLHESPPGIQYLLFDDDSEFCSDSDDDNTDDNDEEKEDEDEGEEEVGQEPVKCIPKPNLESSEAAKDNGSAPIASKTTSSKMITRAGVLQRDPLPPLNTGTGTSLACAVTVLSHPCACIKDAYEEHVLHTAYFLVHPDVNEVPADHIDTLEVLRAMRRKCGLHLSYITTASLDACIQLCPKLRRLKLVVPCLDLTDENASKYMQTLPPHRLLSQPSFVQNVQSSRLCLVELCSVTASSFPRAQVDTPNRVQLVKYTVP